MPLPVRPTPTGAGGKTSVYQKNQSKNNKRRKKCKGMKVDLFEISCELEGISGMITTLSNSFEDGGTHLSDAYMTTTLYSIAKHIDRIIKDVDEIEEKQFEKENIK